MEAIIVRLMDLGYAAEAVTIKDANDDYNVYVNSRLGMDQQKDALGHELEHIALGHFWDERPVMELEKEAEKGTAALSDGLVKNTVALG